MSKCNKDDNKLPKPILPEDKVRPVKICCLDLFDNRMKTQSSSIKPSEIKEENPVIGCFDLYRRKMKLKTDTDERTDSFLHALKYSFHSERVQIVEKTRVNPHYTEEYLSLITPDEKKGVKNVGIPFNLLPEVGKVLHWCRTDSYWLIISQEETEKAYFKGTIEKCNYILSWRDDNGNIYKQRVKIQGPVETKYKNEVLGDFIGGKANETNSIWIAKTENTKHLNRYDKLIINGKGYEIAVVNDVDSIIKINMVEGYINPEEDLVISGEEISEGQINIDYKMYSTVDGMVELPNKPFEFNTALYKDGELLIYANPTISISDNATYSNGIVYPTGAGVIEIYVCYDNYPISKKYIINIVDEEKETITYEILGSDILKMYDEAVYQLVKNINGNITVLNGKLIETSSDKVVIKNTEISAIATPKKLGVVKLFAKIDGEVIEKEVKIINPW